MFWISDNFSISKESEINFIWLNSPGLFKHMGQLFIAATGFTLAR